MNSNPKLDEFLAEETDWSHRWRRGLRVAAAVGAMLWILVSYVTAQEQVSGLIATNSSAVQVTQIYTGALLNCVAALGLCVALYVLSTIGQ